ncbi:hypothetical protein CXG51_26220 [Pseudomonas guariconensis]|nr:hypothetical protein CXG51_26220 [Pseudomonas guariconensis]
MAVPLAFVTVTKSVASSSFAQGLQEAEEMLALRYAPAPLPPDSASCERTDAERCRWIPDGNAPEALGQSGGAESAAAKKLLAAIDARSAPDGIFPV